jgi:UDP-N-acetylglucosamine 1-carboxyvinyltransferase
MADMEKLVIRGGQPLSGPVSVAGSKNATLPIMAACLLTDEPVLLEGAPRVTDVETLSRVLNGLGMETILLPSGALHLHSNDTARSEADPDLVRRMRASFCVLGPLLARRGYAKVSLPGGCRIGDRPVDLHLKGLEALGAEISTNGGQVIARARRLRGTAVNLLGRRGPSVTGTCNVMSAAVLADGDTWIEGAAREPEVIDLGNFLRALGAKIQGIGTSRIHIRGVSRLRGAQYRIIPDRIEAATWMAAAAATRGSLRLSNVRRYHLTAVIATLRQIGLTIETDGIGLTVHGDRPLRAARVTAEPYPGVPTDVQAQLTTLLAITPGTSTVKDEVFPERFQHTHELRRMGAQIRQRDNLVQITGVSSLSGAEVTATDLRASAALVLAALAARGETTIRQIAHLDRGYEKLDEKLCAIGANVRRLQDEPATERRAA